MNPVLLSALALTHVSTTSPAENPLNDWTRLDADLAGLSRALQDEKPGAEVTAWLKTAYRSSGDIMVNGNDEGGVQLQGARINVKGKVGAFELKASVDGTSGGSAGNLSTKDFYARTALGGGIHLQVGNFKAPFLFTAVESDEKQIFFDRSTNGALWSDRDAGLLFDGVHGPFSWLASAQNGGDVQGDEWLLVGKAAFAITGDPIPMKQSGGYGTESPTRLQVAAGYADDGSALIGTATATCAEFTAITGPVFGHAEMVDYDDGFVTGSVASGSAKKVANANVADTTPWGVTGGFMFTEQDEASVRYEDLDDPSNSTRIWVGYTRYFSSHAAKLQVNWITLDSDAGDVDEILAGLTVSI